MIAIVWNLSFGEIVVALVVAVLIFGKRLPQVAGQAFRQLARLRRYLDDLRRESGIEREIYDVKRTFRDVARDVEAEPTGSRPYPGNPAWKDRREPPAIAAAEDAPPAQEPPLPEEPVADVPPEADAGPPEGAGADGDDAGSATERERRSDAS